MEQPWHRFYDESVPHTLTYPHVSLPELLEESGRIHSHRPALIFFGTVLNYRKLIDQINRLAAALSALGVEEGDRVALLFPNCPQAVIAYYAVLKLGAIVVQTNPLYKEEEIVRQWQDAGCETAIVLDRLLPRGNRLWNETPVRRRPMQLRWLWPGSVILFILIPGSSPGRTCFAPVHLHRPKDGWILRASPCSSIRGGLPDLRKERS